MSDLAGPQTYHWPEGKRMAACLSFDFDGPSPYLWANRAGSPLVVGELEQRRFGPRVGVWRILELLSDVGIEGSFFVPGAIADSHPRAVESILQAGHEVGLHGYLHERVEALSSDELTDVLHRSMEAFRRIGASGPFGYRSPSWEMTEDAWAALLSIGVSYDSSLMGSDVPYVVDGLVEVPVEWSLDDAVFYRYTSGTVRPPTAADALLDAWTAEIEAARHYGTLAVFTMHPWISGRAVRAVALRRLLERYIGDPEIWWATAAAIAAHHRSAYSGEASHGLRPGAI